MNVKSQSFFLKTFSLLLIALSAYGFYRTWQGGRAWAQLATWSQCVGQRMHEATPFNESIDMSLPADLETPTAADCAELQTDSESPGFVWHPRVLAYALGSFAILVLGVILFRQTR